MTPTATGGPGFVGRARELAELREWLSLAQTGRGRMVVIRGEPGMGKTRLAEELASIAQAQDIPVVWGRCSADSGAPTLWPLRRIADQLPGHLGGLPAADSETFGSSSEGAAAARFKQFVWFNDAVAEAALDAGLLVIVEDMHWADSGTVAALDHLAADIGRSNALVVVTTRSGVGPTADAEAGILDRAGVEHRKLSGLDRIEIADYLAAVNGATVDARYADLVLRQTAGNSLFVGAVTRLLTERVALQSFDPAAAQTALSGRPELVDLIREPMSRISAESRSAVEWASVCGDEFDAVELAGALNLPADGTTAALDDAILAGLLTRASETPGTVRFVHALIREGVYDNVPREVRSRAHRAWAEAIETNDPAHERIGTVARHLSSGASSPAEHLRAATAAQHAGRAALTDLAHAEAAGHFRSALYSLAMVGAASPSERAEILLDLALAEYRSGAFNAALEHCARAADLAQAEHRWDLLARAALLVDGVSLDGNSVETLCRRAIARLPDAELSVRAQLQSRLAYAAAEAGDLGRAAAMSADALALAEQTRDPAAVIAALRARHQALSGPGLAEERLALGARAIELAEAGEPLAALWGRLWRIDASFELSDLVAVDHELVALKRIAEELRFPLARWHFRRLQAAREALVGRFALAEKHARAARDLAGELEDPSVVPLYYAFQLYLLYTRGPSGPGMDPELRGFLALAEQIDLPIVYASLATLLLSTGDTDEAARIARRLAAQADDWPMDGMWMVTVAMLGNVVADVQAKDCAEGLYRALAPFAALSVTGAGGAVACEGSVSRPLGRLAATLSLLDVAEGHLHDAIAAEDEMGARPFAALSRMYLAEVLQARGGAQNLASAAKHARTALAAMRAMDMRGRAIQCEDLLAAIDANTATRTGLTRREAEIVGLVAAGLSNRQIADQLFVSERTVETHVSHVLGKLGASTRTEIATWAVAGGFSAADGR